MSAKQDSRSMNIFDLPLELRQQIYRECMPENGYMLLNHDAADYAKALRETHPVIATEFREEENRSCRTLHFLVTATKWKAPPPLCRSTNINVDIEFDLYPYNPLPWPHGHDDYPRNVKLNAMGDTLWAFTQWIKNSNISIDWLYVCFRGSRKPHPQWCQEHYDPEDGTSAGFSLATSKVDKHDEPLPVLERLMMSLQHLPVVKDAEICILERIEGWDVLLHRHDIEVLYDWDYMVALCESWEDCLMGKRDVVRRSYDMVRRLKVERPDVDRLLPRYLLDGMACEEKEKEAERLAEQLSSSVV